VNANASHPGPAPAGAPRDGGPARVHDVICMGRAAVDLYGEQIGARLEDVSTFARYLGGSPANTAVGCARLGLRAAMLTRVGDEQNGRYVRAQLVREGVDVSHVRTDPQRLTALVFLSVRSGTDFPLLFYRDRCADMALAVDDIDPAFIASSRALLVSGTHLSQPGPRAACEKAIAAARAAGTRVVLDVDYRPVLWGLTGLGDGATRYVASSEVTRTLQRVLPLCDLVVGTEEEIRIAGGADSTVAALQGLRACTNALVVLKRGPAGCVLFEGAIPPSVDEGLVAPGFPVEVFNVLGAGDAFMAGFLSGWLRSLSLAECGRCANACGALVVSRHGCAPAIPTREELSFYLLHGSRHRRLREDVALEHVHRKTTRAAAPRLIAALAFDHRSQFEELAAQHGAPFERIGHFKRLIAAGARRALAAEPGAGLPAPIDGGLIVDDRHGAALLPEFDDWWVARPVESPGSRPLAFEDGRNVQAMLRAWPRAHVAKCLVSWHPDDDAALRALQLERLRDLATACADTGRELLLEVIPPASPGRTRGGDEAVRRALAQIVDAGVRPDWWKLVAPQDEEGWEQLAHVVGTLDGYCRGVLVLGQDAPLPDLADTLARAAPHGVCRGFAVGRSIFFEAARAWFAGRADDETAVASIAGNYQQLVRAFAGARARAGLPETLAVAPGAARAA
jgi:5-dehydro-2-deoxygluconokinase